VAVGLRFRHDFRARDAAAARPVVDHHRLTEKLGRL
jgi:hypothetical protein